MAAALLWLASVDLRGSVGGYAFDADRFRQLRERVGDGSLDPTANRLSRPPMPLQTPPVDLTDKISPERRAELTERGNRAIKSGKAAVLVLNGGMATRFGGGAKGVVSVVAGQPRTSFLAIKLADARRRAQRLGGTVPVVLMHSFATQGPSQGHLAEIDWAGISQVDRDWFAQSIMPRVLPDGTPLADFPEAAKLPDTALYSAPGHGDTLGRLRNSGVLGRLQARGVDHILVSNVDNVGASLDPLVLGAHLEAVDRGAGISVEVVRRIEGDAGGCVAQLPDTQVPAIVEGFRLPAGTDLSHYPHFNTNTLWLSASAVDRDIELTWFAVRKKIPWPVGDRAPEGTLEVVQFERLIGQATELVPSAYLDVDRGSRFVPIKTRDDLSAAAPQLEVFAREAGLI